MKKLVFVSLIIAFIHANPQANQQAFQQGYNSINSFNSAIDAAKAPLQGFVDAVARSKREAEALIEYANRLNPQTLEGCKQVRFVTEFCFVNFAKELKEEQERADCRVEARILARALVDPYATASNPFHNYEKKNCARFAPRPVKKDTK